MSENNSPNKEEVKLKANEFILIGVQMKTPDIADIVTVTLLSLMSGLMAIFFYQEHFISINSAIAIIVGALTALISGAYGISLSKSPFRSAVAMFVVYVIVSNMVLAAAGDLIVVK